VPIQQTFDLGHAPEALGAVATGRIGAVKDFNVEDFRQPLQDIAEIDGQT
jgi:hypothetical protein